MISRLFLSFKALYLLILAGLLASIATSAQSDECASATLITDVANYCSVDGAYTNAGSTQSGLANATCWTGGPSNDVWFQFTAIASNVFVTATGSGASPMVKPRVALYGGNCASMSQLACGDGNATNSATQVYWGSLTPGTVYYIRVSSIAGNTGTFKLCINNYNPPFNPSSDCGGAARLCTKDAVSITQFSGGGTQEVTSTCMGTESNSVWYYWTCGTSGPLNFDIFPSNPDNDIDFVLFELSTADPCGARTAVRCNVASCSTGYAGKGTTGLNPLATTTTETSNCNPGANAYCSTLNMVAGVSYVLVVNNANAFDGFTLNFSSAPGTGTFKGASPKIVSSSDTICAGTTVNYDGNTSTGYDNLSWNFISGPGSPNSASGPGPHAVRYDSVGVFTAILDATLAGCPKATKAKTIVVNQSPKAPTAISSDVCSGNTIQLYANNGTGNFNWSGPASFTSTLQNPTIASATTANSGTYSVYTKIGKCQSPASTVNVNVVQRKNPGLDNSITICNTQTSVNLQSTLLGTPDAGGTWTAIGTAPAGYSGGSTFNTAGLAAGTYQFLYTLKPGAPCADTTAKVTVTVNRAAVAGADKTLKICGLDTVLDLKTQLGATAMSGGSWTRVGTFAGNLNASTGIFDSDVLPEGTYKFQYTVTATAPCVNDVADITLVLVRKPYAGMDSTLVPVCQSVGSIDVQSAVGPLADAGGNWSGGATVSAGTVNVGSLKGAYTITYTSVSSNTSVCPSDQAVVKFTVNDPPTFTVNNLVCNSINDKISATVTISGGQTSSYNVSFSPAISGNLNGSTYTTGPINPGTYTITVTDGNACTPVSSQTIKKVCNCTSDAGTMTPTTDTLRICGTGAASASQAAGTEVKDGNDALSYVIHTASGENMGTIYGRSISPVFSLDTSVGMQFDKVYYISAVVGDKDAVNQADTANKNGCLSVAAGRAVIWRRIPQAGMSINPANICLGLSSNLVFTLAFNPPYKVTLSDGTIISNLSPAANTYALNPTVAGKYTYTAATVMDRYGCSNNFSSSVTLTVFDSPVIDLSSVTTTCNSTNTGYTIQFKVSGGDKSTYSFSGTAGTFNPATDQFTSGVINNGTTYNFVVNDANNCDPDTLTNTHTCPCTTDPGTMSNTASVLEFCQSQLASAAGIHKGNQTLDGNDTLSFVICTNPADPIGSRVIVSSVPTFPFIAPLVAGTTYFIAPVAGDNDGAGIVDFTKGCRKAAPGTPVRWLPEPTASLQRSVSEICKATSAAFQLGTQTFAGRAVDITVKAQGYSQLFSINSAQTLSIPDPVPSLEGDSIRAWIDNNVKYSTAPFCPGKWALIDTQKVAVIPAPAAVLQTTNYLLCQGQTMPLNFTTSGRGNVNVSYTGGSFVTNAGNARTVVMAPFNAAGNSSYQIISVTSTSASGTTCPGTGSGLVQYDVKLLPVASASFIQNSICYDKDGRLDLTAIAATPAATIYYNQDGQNKNIAVPTAGQSISYIKVKNDIHIRLDSVVDNNVSSYNSNGCASSLSNNLTLVVRPLPIGVISGGGAICEGSSAMIDVNITGTSPFNLVYSDGSMPNASNVEHFTKSPTVTTSYSLVSITDATGCMATSLSGTPVITVNKNPVPVFASANRQSCPPLFTTINNQTNYANIPGSTCTWKLNGNAVLKDCSDLSLNLDDPGAYDIELEIKSGFGCIGTTRENDYLMVHPFPIPEFSFDQSPTTFLYTVKSFTNHSHNADTTCWYFYNSETRTLLDSVTTRDTEYKFPDKDEGLYDVRLRVASEFGCVAELVRRIRVDGELLIYTPNTFTPNDDGINEGFKPELEGYAPASYEFFIFNRWGQQLFYTKDPHASWDGTFGGEYVQEGIYTYRLIVQSRYKAERRDILGKVNLMR